MTTLTPRQAQILSLVADGLTNAEVGRRLGIGEQAVKNHIQRITYRLDLPWGERTKTIAAAWFVRHEQARCEALRAHLDGGCLVFANQQSALAALGQGEERQ